MILNKRHEVFHQEHQILEGSIRTEQAQIISLKALHFVSGGYGNAEVPPFLSLHQSVCGVRITISEARELAEALNKASDWLEINGREAEPPK